MRRDAAGSGSWARGGGNRPTDAVFSISKTRYNGNVPGTAMSMNGGVGRMGIACHSHAQNWSTVLLVRNGAPLAGGFPTVPHSQSQPTYQSVLRELVHRREIKENASSCVVPRAVAMRHHSPGPKSGEGTRSSQAEGRSERQDRGWKYSIILVEPRGPVALETEGGQLHMQRLAIGSAVGRARCVLTRLPLLIAYRPWKALHTLFHEPTSGPSLRAPRRAACSCKKRWR